jgi:hypothetical protein
MSFFAIDHAAGIWGSFQNRGGYAELAQAISTGQAADSGADDRYALG